MWPKAIGNGTGVRQANGLLRISRAARGEEFILDPLAELVWNLCDGSRTVEALTEQAGQGLHRSISREDIFSTLDFLADAGLLERRIAPPAAEAQVSRRALLARFRPAISTAASLAIIGPSAKADEYSSKESSSKESNSKESNNKANSRESSSKESNSKANHQEDNRKEDNTKHNRQEDNSKEDKAKYNHQEDNTKEDQAKYRRQEDNNKEDDRREDLRQRRGEENQKESNRKSINRNIAAIIRNQDAEDSIRARWPQVYTLVGHKLSEFPRLAAGWRTARDAVLSAHGLAWATSKWGAGDGVDNWSLFVETCSKFDLWLSSQFVGFSWLGGYAGSSQREFKDAGFAVSTWAGFVGQKPVRLTGSVRGFESARIDLQLEHVGPANTYIGVLDPDNIRWSFTDPVVALQFLSLRDKQ